MSRARSLIAFALAVVPFAACSNGDDTPGTTSASVVTTDPVTTEPVTTASTTVPGITAVGDTVALPDGTLARVNALTLAAAPTSEFVVPAAGFTFTRVEVELCAGSEGAVANPLYWTAILDDAAAADLALGGGDFATVGLTSGGCTRGWLDFNVPDGRAVASLALSDALLTQVARWDVENPTPVGAPLTAPSAPAATALGALVTLPAGDGATLQTVTPNAVPSAGTPAPADGRALVQIDVALCAGSEPLPISPLYWLVTTTDHYTGGAVLGSGTLPALDLAPGQCASGSVQIDIPAAAVVQYVLLTDPVLDEVARWVVG